MDPQPSSLDVNSASVQTHLAMLQGVINRLAANSAVCKTWCVTLVSAIAVVAATESKAQLILVAICPIALFAALDSYYLGLERRFRGCYTTFAKKLHAGTANIEDVFINAPKLPIPGLFKEAFESFASFSIWPFYVGLLGILWFLGTRIT